METIKGVDSSYDELTIKEATCLQRKGIKIFVQALTALPRTGIHQPPHRITNLETAYYGGLATAGYLLIGPGMTGWQAVTEARRGIPIDVWKRLKFVAVDVEVVGILDTEILAALKEIERLGRTAIVYTSWNAWNTMVRPRNSTLISNKGYGLWNASWDNRQGIDYRLSFGGWSSRDVVGEQWSGGTVICGQSVDQNTFKDFVLNPKPEPIISPIFMKSDLRLAIVKEPLMGQPAWWLTTYPFAWKMHITNLMYMKYMQQKEEWPTDIWTLTHNQKQIFKGIYYLGAIPRPIEN